MSLQLSKFSSLSSSGRSSWVSSSSMIAPRSNKNATVEQCPRRTATLKAVSPEMLVVFTDIPVWKRRSNWSVRPSEAAFNSNGGIRFFAQHSSFTSFNSQPLLIKTSAVAVWPPFKASYKAEQPNLSRRLMFAPWDKRYLTVSVCPLSAATCNGVSLLWSRALTSAPFWTR